MADSSMPSVGDHPDHLDHHPDHGPVPLMFTHPFGFGSMPDSALPSPFSQHGAVQEPYEHAASAPIQGSLMSWFKDGPWVPPNCVTGCDGHSASRMNGPVPAAYSFAYPGYRDACVPSECGTTPTGIEPSDSGYGSNTARLSIANTSVLGEPPDRCPETQSLAGRLSDFNFNVLDPRQASMWQQPQPLPVDYRSSHLDAKGLVCGTCHKQVKTPSELKKHQQRHTKPHHCRVPGCNRTEGFSTSNDLDRHTRSVHPNEVVAGNRYQCTIGLCKTKDKSWPRADNFRAHLKRVHSQTDVSDEALELYICRPQQLAQDGPMDGNTSHQLPPQYNVGAQQLGPGRETSFTPSLLSRNNEQVASSSKRPGPYNGIALSTAPVGSDHMDLGHMTGGTGSVDHVVMSPSEDGGLSMPDLEDMSSAAQKSQSAPNGPPAAIDPVGQNQLQFVVPGDLSQRNCTPGFPASTGIKSAQSLFELPGTPLRVPATASPASLTDDEPDASDTSSVIILDATSDRRLQDDASQEPERTAPVGQTSVLLQLDMSNDESVKKVVEALANSGKLEALGFRKEVPTPADKTEDSNARLRQEHQHHCLAENCDKTFARPCELKKHAKRHSKPYGCTYPGCNKNFGSKNDLKRHENGQHFLLEVWKCEEPRTKQSSESCGRVSHRRETFKDHLTKFHGLHGHDLENKLEMCRAGRSFEARSWCGFCEKIVETPQKGAAWTERFNHIDDHIHGRNGFSRKKMDEWKYLDPNVSQPLYSGSDTDDDDDDGSRSAPPDAAQLTREPQQGHSRNTVAVKRRTTDIEPDERQNKRARRDQPIMPGVITCCRCAEGNSTTGPQCVSSVCQHRLCPDCPREFFDIPIGDDGES